MDQNILNQQYYKQYDVLSASESYVVTNGEYYPQVSGSNSYYPSQNYSYDYASEVAYNSSLTSSVPTAEPTATGGNSFWNPRRKFYSGGNQSSQWTDSGLTSSESSSSYGGNPYRSASNPYSNRSSNLTVDTNASYPRSVPGYGNFTSPTYGDELEKISPHRRHGNSRTSPASKQNFNKRNTLPPDGFIYQVQFKRAHRNFILAPSAPRDLLPGDFVKVEADRGEDMGIVLAKCPAESFEEVIPTAGYRGRGFSSGQGERKYLFRRATPEERASLATKVADEEKALEFIREKTAERGFPMQILDAEYQYDRHKLTFFFEADRRIDFRDLVSELFSLYKTRIWMQQVDISTVSPHDAGIELAKATGFLPDRDDVISRRSSFTTSNEDPLSGEASRTDFNDVEQYQAIESFHLARKTSKNTFEDIDNDGNDIPSSSNANAYNFTESWYTSNYLS